MFTQAVKYTGNTSETGQDRDVATADQE